MSNEIAYAAGLFDGEGTVTLGKGSNPKAFRRVEVTLSSTDQCLCDIIRNTFKVGEVYLKQSRKPDHWAQAYEFRVSGDKAINLITEILPFSRHPKKIARIKHIIEKHKLLTVRNGKYTPEQKAAKEQYEAEFFAL